MSETLSKLLHLMACLRDEVHGCPWDKKQTFASIAPYTVEEVYEVVDAIQRNDLSHLREELGDLLFQIVFYCQMAHEMGEFSFENVVQDLLSKMIRRHPHVFPSGELTSFGQASQLSEAEIRRQWEQIKALEKTSKSDAQHESILDTVPINFPPLLQAVKLQKKASSVGFDWDQIKPVLDKIREELDELEQEVQANNIHNIQGELGDVLFAMANLARHLNVDPDQALQQTNAKFRRRFGYIERCLKRNNLTFDDCSLDTLDGFWDEAKTNGL